MTTMSEKMIRQFLINMQLLGYKPNSQQFFTDFKLFETSKKSQFENMVKFLFTILDSNKAGSLFSDCFPCVSHQHSQKFRMACVNWWKTIAHQNPELNLPKVTGMMLKDLCGNNIVNLMFKFSVYVLREKTLQLAELHTVLKLPVQCSGVLKDIQMTSIKASVIIEHKKITRQLQMMRQEKNNVTMFIDKHVKGYREALKKNNLLREERNKLLLKEPAKKPTYSRSGNDVNTFSESDYENSRKLLNKPLTANRKMNKNLSASLAQMKTGQEIIDLILRQNKNGKITLDAEKMDVRVPSLLLNKHTDDVYKKIGPSLYRNGLLNMQSVAALFNLSLCLLNEKLHHDGLPNFESDLDQANAQIHIIVKNSSTLYNLRQRAILQNPVILSRITELKQQIKLKLKYNESSIPSNIELPTSSIFISPNKFPWSKNRNILFSTESSATDMVPMISLGPHVTSVPSPKKVLNFEEPPVKQSPKFVVQNVQSFPEHKKTIKKPKKYVTKPLKELKSIENVFNPKATPEKKPKTVSERAMSNLVKHVVDDFVDGDSPESQTSVSKFDLSLEISNGAFENRPLLAQSPNLLNDSVFESSNAILDRQVLINMYGEKNSHNNRSVALESECTITEAEEANNENAETPTTAVSIESKFFREQSRIFSTDESGFENSPIGLKTPVNYFDLRNDDLEIPKELLYPSSDEDKDTTAKNTLQSKSGNIPTANFLNLSFAPMAVPIDVLTPLSSQNYTAVDQNSETFVPDLIDFSGF